MATPSGAFSASRVFDVGGGGSLDFGFAGRRALFRAGPLGFSPARSETETPADAASFAALRTDAGEGGGGIFDFRRVRLRVVFPTPYAATVSARSAFARGDAPPPESRVRGELERDAEPGDGLSV